MRGDVAGDCVPCCLKLAAELLGVLPEYKAVKPAEVRQRVAAVLEQEVQEGGSVPAGVKRALEQAKAGLAFDLDAFLVLAKVVGRPIVVLIKDDVGAGLEFRVYSNGQKQSAKGVQGDALPHHRCCRQARREGITCCKLPEGGGHHPLRRGGGRRMPMVAASQMGECPAALSLPPVRTLRGRHLLQAAGGEVTPSTPQEKRQAQAEGCGKTAGGLGSTSL